MLQEIVILAIALLLLVRKALDTWNKRDWLFLVAAILAGASTAAYENASILAMFEGILIFNGIVTSYHSRQNYAFYALAVFFIASFYPQFMLISQAVLLGFLSGSYLFLKPNKSMVGSFETRRDLVQIVAGFILIVAYLTLPLQQVAIGIVCAIVLASAIGNYGVRNRKSVVSKTLYAFERENAMLGQGAMWLAMGILAAISLLSASHMIAVFAAILIGDAVATLVGTAYRIPIPYNKKKSVAGTAAYFISAALISFPFLGYFGILTSLVGAVVESAPRQIDDNFDTAIVLIVLIKILAFAGLA